MNVLILGDIHGKFLEASSFYDALMQTYKFDVDLLIQVGDFGFWPYHEPAFPRAFPHRCAFIDGNHSHHRVLRTLDQPQWGMNREPSLAWKKTLEQWEYKKRGTIADGILYIGGARSINPCKQQRGIDWFPEENISYREQEEIFDAIESYGPDRIHTVISHDCPGSFKVAEACTHSGIEMIDGNRKFLEAVRQIVRPSYWFFGHYHKKMMGIVDETEWRCIDMIREGGATTDFVFLELPDGVEDGS